MKKIIIAVAALAAIAAHGDTLLISRIDGNEGAASTQTYGVVLPEFELWGFGVDGLAPSYELGRLWPVGTGVFVGGYASWWPHQGQLYLEPFVMFQRKVGDISLTSCQGIYIPLGDGQLAWFSADTSVTTEIAENMQAGVSAHWWHQEGYSAIHFGPSVSVRTGKFNLSGRYCPFGDSQATWRLEASTTF